MELKKRVVILLQLELEKYNLGENNDGSWQQKALIDGVIKKMNYTNVRFYRTLLMKPQERLISEVQKILYLTEISISDMKEALIELRGLY